jgi:hypothetical protein
MRYARGSLWMSYPARSPVFTGYPAPSVARVVARGCPAAVPGVRAHAIAGGHGGRDARAPLTRGAQIFATEKSAGSLGQERLVEHRRQAHEAREDVHGYCDDRCHRWYSLVGWIGGRQSREYPGVRVRGASLRRCPCDERGSLAVTPLPSPGLPGSSPGYSVDCLNCGRQPKGLPHRQ